MTSDTIQRKEMGPKSIFWVKKSPPIWSQRPSKAAARLLLRSRSHSRPRYGWRCRHSVPITPLQKRPQVWFELLAEIPVAHELFMKMLPENAKIKKIYRGTLLLVYINTKNSNSLLNKIFHQNLRWWSVSAPIRWIWLKIITKMIFYHILVKKDLKSQYE